MFRRKPLRWSIVVSAPRPPAGDQWGDTVFARDLVAALERAGHRAKVVFRPGAESEGRESDDVVVVLRGLNRVVPRRGKAAWLLWVISHPELVDIDEPAQYDAVFAASAHWSRAADFGVPVTPLLQATAPERFTPDAGAADSGAPVLFVGSTRGEYRPAVRACVDAGIEVDVYGVGWSEYLPAEHIAGEFLDPADLPRAYASAGVVLNDHWPDMAQEGFLSNRLFDATATGARVLSDQATGLDEVFGDVVTTYSTSEELVQRLEADRSTAFADRETRLALAQKVAREHSFDARAAVLIERARLLR
ncbi:MAG: glycosyltransferase [Candidatus Nanopelagicales bacterium]|nr:glycosyltransferase [Candidatus Nanopelagicales bacterium]MCF8541912.1 glycosyltransferase [Candidatus Nanopelagicales bacterium]MCF8556017.1 glycosyltransferase [Candidatus Nanopelagicales bacterium]